MKKLLSLISLIAISITTLNTINYNSKQLSSEINSLNHNLKKDLTGEKFEFNIQGISQLRDGSMLQPTFIERMFYLMKYYGLTGDLSEYVHQGFPFNFENQAVWDQLGSLCGFDKKSDRGIISDALENAKLLNVTIKGEIKSWPYGYNSFVIQSISAQKSPVDISEIIPKNYFLEQHTNTFVYNKEQTIAIKEKYVRTAILDGANITIPATNILLNSGKHSLVLTLKDEFKQSAILFGGNENTGEINLNFWIKTAIDDKEISYQTNKDDTDLLTGLVSDGGNTNGCGIIQTRSKQGSVHSATLNLKLDDAMLDYTNSYYVQGTVDETSNNFTETGTKQKLEANAEIKTDGTYHLHLVDMVENTYDSYLELGESNWKLKGNFDDQSLNDLSNKLNVTVNLTNPTQKQEAMGWLQNYQADAEKIFSEITESKGKGFNITINDLPSGYKEFLDPITYNNPDSKEDINKNKLNQVITIIADKDLKDGLSGLPQDLNVDTSNVVNKSTLDSYTNWINGYQKFIADSKDKWINQIIAIASRGFASPEQIQQIQQHINQVGINGYLKPITWTSNSFNYLKSTTTDDDYLNLVQLDKLQSDTIIWTNLNLPDINQKFESALSNAESNVNLHGYTINQLLNGKELPKNKTEIDNFANGTSFHDYLQTQANSKFHGWQLQMGLGIGLPLLLVTAGIGIIIRWRTDPRYNPLARARKDDRADKRAAKKGQ